MVRVVAAAAATPKHSLRTRQDPGSTAEHIACELCSMRSDRSDVSPASDVSASLPASGSEHKLSEVNDVRSGP